MFDVKRTTLLMRDLHRSAEALQQMPEMVPIAREILKPVFNGYRNTPGRFTGAPKLRFSAARRKQMSLMAKKRWAKAKRAGKNTIGGAER